MVSILVARVIGFEGAGVNALGLTISNVFYPVALYGVRGFQVSDIHDQYSRADYTYLRFATTTAAVFLFAIMLCCVPLSAAVVLCAVAYTAIRVLESFSDLFFGFFQKRDRLDFVFVSYLLKSGATLAVAWAALQFTNSVPFIVTLMAVVFAATFLGYDLPKAGRAKLGRPDAARIRILLKACFPLMAFGFVTPYVNFVVRYLVEIVYGTEIQGYYSSIAILQAVMSVLTSSIWVVFVPTFARLHHAGEMARLRRLIVRILVWVSAASVLAVAATIPLGGPILRFVYGPAILPYVHLLLLVVVISAFLSVVMLLNTVLVSVGRNTVMLLGNAGGAVALTAGAYPLIKFSGVSGANTAMLGCVVLQMVLVAIPVVGTLKERSRGAGQSSRPSETLSV